MTIDDLIKVLEESRSPDQGLRYHNGSPKRRYNSETGEPYMTFDRTELSLFGDRANNFYRIIQNAPRLIEQLRALQSGA